MKSKIRFGMVGGGADALIGAVHRMAARLDGRAQLVCGAFSSRKEKSYETGKQLFLPTNRAYGTYREMFRKESKLPQGERMDFVVIVTPNNMHYPVSMAAIDAGFHVVCDKPMTMTLEEACNLKRKLAGSDLLFCLTHNYTGYPLVKEARDLVRKKKLGRIRRVVVEYPQGWLATRLETTEDAGQKQAAWRTDPKRAGATCCIGDIGSHAHNLVEYITGHHMTEVCAELSTFVKGRQLDDDGSVLFRLDNDATGVLWASQVAVGEENGLNIRVYGEKGSLAWRQEEPNTLTVHWLHKPTEIRRTGTPTLGPEAAAVTRLPPGHPEGYIEAFANIYKAFYDALESGAHGKPLDPPPDIPGVEEGIRGMAFLEAVVTSAKSKDKWTPVNA
jgi:predicted dehydrogenase